MERHLCIATLCLVVISILLRYAECGFCTEGYSCSANCYRQHCSSHSCGWMGTNRCRRCSTKHYTCYKTCYRRFCCDGYQGIDCNQAICHGSTDCPNGGYCKEPDVCVCRPGYSTPTCDDIDECASGDAACSQQCENNLGSFTCSCFEGFQLSFDGKTCDDINECFIDNGGCEHVCTDTNGSFLCSCKDGYEIGADGLSCQDVDECTTDTHKCDQTCKNTVGSYTCGCVDGYTLEIDGRSCYDNDECTLGDNDCEHVCVNEPGSYSCKCAAGYALLQNSSQCEDIDECENNNGGCSDDCDNTGGSFWCLCQQGYTLDEDQRTCIEIDECTDGTAMCDHDCTNTHLSYYCSCQPGYQLMSDGHTCEDMDDCLSVTCHNGGSCIDGLQTYTCMCPSGFTGQHCDSDVNECTVLNGGCEQVCINTPGSYECSCQKPDELRENGWACSDAYLLNNQSGLALPVGDFLIDLNATGELNLSSTLKWYQLNTDNNIAYTHGIVHVETNIFKLPVSLTGLQIDRAKFRRFSTNVLYNASDGTEIPNANDKSNTSELELSQPEKATLIAVNSFSNSYFEGIRNVFPAWAALQIDKNSILPITELATEIITGNQVDSIASCKGAPVFPDRIYNSFVTNADVIVELFGDKAMLSKTRPESKICILVELRSVTGISVFVMFDDRLQEELFNLVPFSSVYNDDSIVVHDIGGFAFSTNKGISIKSKQSDESIEVWNGDHKVQYSLFDMADFWIHGEFAISSKLMELIVKADLFLSLPNPFNLFTDTFDDKWDILFVTKESNGKLYITEDIALPFEIEDFIWSVGGNSHRVSCGENANPAGLFGAVTVYDTPIFSKKQRSTDIVYNAAAIQLVIYILKHTHLSLKANLFVSAGEYTSEFFVSNSQLSFDVGATINEAEICLNNLILKLKKHPVNETRSMLQIANNLTTSFGSFQSNFVGITSKPIADVVNQGLQYIRNMKQPLLEISTLISTYNHLFDGMDKYHACLEVNIANLENILLATVQRSAIALSNWIAKDDGFGFQLKKSISLRLSSKINLSLDMVVIEFVSTKESLGHCGRFHKVFELLKDEESFRFKIRSIKAIPIGVLFGIPVGLSGIGFARSKISHKYVLNALLNFQPFDSWYSKYTISFNLDTFITNTGIHAYGEVSFFSYFFIQLDVAAEFRDRTLEDLQVYIAARFVVGDDRNINDEYTKREKHDRRESFSQSYIDVLTNLLENLANEAKERIEKVQNHLMVAENKLTAAQNWLEDKKAVVRTARAKFDDAIDFLWKRSEDLDEAEDQVNRLSDKLKEARDRVDRLCKIRRCRRICIPGLKCGWVYCRWTSCMISFDDPVCIVKNALCAIVRRTAFLLYDIAISALKIPLLVLDAARAALWSAQIAVDLAKNTLVLAEAAVDLAQIGLEGVNIGIALANKALDLVKVVVAVGFKVLTFILEGVQNLVDVRNCGFDVVTDRPVAPTLGVSCEVNILSTGWTTVHIRINFLNPLQSIWYAAKETFNEIVNRLDILSRKRRDISQIYASQMHPLLRKLRQTDIDDLSNDTLSDIPDLAYPIYTSSGADNDISSNSDFDERVSIYRNKCNVVRQVYRFMSDAFANLSDKCGGIVERVIELEKNITELTSYNSDIFNGMTVDDADIDTDVANTEFNISAEDITSVFNEGMASLQNDSYVLTLLEMTSGTKALLEQEKNDIEHLPVLDEWAANFNDSVSLYFKPDQCVDIYDCMHYSIYQLNELFMDENREEHATSIDAIDEMESTFLTMLNSSNWDIYTILNTSNEITESLEGFVEYTYFCEEAPVLHSTFENATALIGRNITYTCNATGGGLLNYTWYKNKEVMTNVSEAYLSFTNTSVDIHQATYSCTVGNKIATSVSALSYLKLIDACQPGSHEVEGFCIPCPFGSYQSEYGQSNCNTCRDGFTTRKTGSTSEEQCIKDLQTAVQSIDLVLITAVSSTLGVVVIILWIVVGVYIYKKKQKARKVHPIKDKDLI